MKRSKTKRQPISNIINNSLLIYVAIRGNKHPHKFLTSNFRGEVNTIITSFIKYQSNSGTFSICIAG